MTPTPNPAQPSAFEATFRRALQRLADKDVAAWVSMWADDGAMEFPYAPPGYPARLPDKAAIRDYMRDYPATVDIKTFAIDAFHHTQNPDVVIVEFSVEGRAIPTDRPYSMRYVGVITLRDGAIINYRDYWNPMVAAVAFGGPEALTAAFAAGAS
jgi:uncharacterized protein